MAHMKELTMIRNRTKEIRRASVALSINGEEVLWPENWLSSYMEATCWQGDEEVPCDKMQPANLAVKHIKVAACILPILYLSTCTYASVFSSLISMNWRDSFFESNYFSQEPPRTSPIFRYVLCPCKQNTLWFLLSQCDLCTVISAAKNSKHL